MASRFLSWVTGCLVLPFTDKKKQEKVWGQGDDFSFVYVVFEVPGRHSHYG